MQVPALKLSEHAKKRAREFKLYPYDVIQMVHKATEIYPHKGRYVAKCGEWAIVFSAQDNTIITILRNTQDRWTH